jgi:hypothetical protein
MSKRQEFLDWLKAQVGVTEEPPGSSNVPYNTDYYGYQVNDPKAHWCATFQRAGLKAIGCQELYYGGKKTANCPALLTYYQEQGQVVAEPEPGDLVFYDWDASGKPDHVGAVERVAAGAITTVEGNVGDAVKRLVRARDGKIQAFVRLRWPDEQEAEPKPEPTPTPETEEIVAPFTDVPKKAWYAKAVEWAKGCGVVAGLTEKLFGPNSGATRAQIVQMLFKLDKLYEKRFKDIEQEVADLKKRVEAMENKK